MHLWRNSASKVKSKELEVVVVDKFSSSHKSYSTFLKAET